MEIRRKVEEASGVRVRVQRRHELHVCVAFLCLSFRDFHDLGGSTSARSEKGDGRRVIPALKISVVFRMVRASVRIVLSVNGDYCDGTLSRRVTTEDEMKVFGKEDE